MKTLGNVVNSALGLNKELLDEISDYGLSFNIEINENNIANIIAETIHDGKHSIEVGRQLLNYVFKKVIQKTIMRFPFLEDVINNRMYYDNGHLWFENKAIQNSNYLDEVLKPFVEEYNKEEEKEEKTESAHLEEKPFEYPDILEDTDEMYTKATRLNSDNAIFGGRKALLEKYFAEYPIYVNGSYYVQSRQFPKVFKNEDGLITTFNYFNFGDDLSEWRECHYYTLMDYKGHKFYMMSGGRYD